MVCHNRTVRLTDSRVEQSQVVVDLGDGAYRRAGVTRRRLLINCDSKRQSFDKVDIGFVHLTEGTGKSVGRQTLNVASLALGEDRVECGLDLPDGQPCEDDQGIARGRSRFTSRRFCARVRRER